MAARAAFARNVYGSDDDSDSDDSGFDEGLSTDEVLKGRIAKMRDMMNLHAAKEVKKEQPKSVAPPAPPPSTTTTPTTAPVTSTTPAQPDTTPTTANDDDGEDEFLFVDKVHDLSLSSHQVKPAIAPPAPEPEPEQPKPPQQQVQPQEEEEEEEEEDDGYTVTWTRGDLGLLFKEGPKGETLIRRVNKKKSSAEGLHIARAGDVLVALDGKSVRGRPFQELVEQLRLPNFPVRLEFQPQQDSDDDGERGGNDTFNGHSIAAPQPPVQSEQQQQQLPPPPPYQQGETKDFRRMDSYQQELERKESSLSASSSTFSEPPPPYYRGSEDSPFAAKQMEIVAAHRLNHQTPSYSAVLTPSSQQYSTPYSPRDAMEDLPGPGEFDVVWRQGALGCGLKQINGVPTIKNVTPGAALDESVKQLAPGDVMVLINGLNPDTIGFRGVVETMQRAPKPVYMRFRRAGYPPNDSSSRSPGPVGAPPSRHASREIENLRESRVGMEDLLEASLGPRQYTVLWTEGPLGVQIKARSSDGAVIVSKFTGTGDPATCSQIQVGDVFVRIAGVEIAHLGISGTHELLRTVQKPVVVVFERSRASNVPSTIPPAISPSLPAFDPEDTRESAVPSFRELRERQAAARAQQTQLRGRESFSGFSPEQRGEVVYGAAGRRAAHDRLRPPAYGDFGGGYISEDRRSDGDAPARHQSFSRSEPNDQASDQSFHSNGHVEDDALLPRFSDIETGRVKTATVTSLPPPPSYFDVFTQSGRALDPRLLGQPSRRPPSHQGSDDHFGGSDSASSSQGYAPSPHTPSYGQNYSRGQQQQLNMSMSPYMQPPPAYDKHLGTPRNNQRVDVLRQQYIQAERVRNTVGGGGGREPSNTQLSTYSDLDDSGLMAPIRRPKAQTPAPPHDPAPPPPPYAAVSNAPAQQQKGSVDLGASTVSVLPPPELWIQWSEGPLGITFRRVNGQIVVSRLTGAGYSRGLEQLRPGDWLVSFGSAGVGSYSTDDLRLSETMELIKTLPKPVDMCFVVR